MQSKTAIINTIYSLQNVWLSGVSLQMITTIAKLRVQVESLRRP